jgi:hypothetical protein
MKGVGEVLELLVLGVLAAVGLAMFGLLWAVLSLVCWVILLPFKLLGLVFRGFAFLLALPFLLIVGILAAVVFGTGLLLFMIPALPFVLLVLGIWWLVRRRDRTAHVSA